MLRKCHGHGLTKGDIIQIFYHGLDEPTQRILDGTAEGIFLYKSPNQAFQLLEDKVLFQLDWFTKSQNEHHQKYVAFADKSSNNDDNSRIMKKLEALTIKMDSQFYSLKEEMQDMCNKYYDLRDNHAPKNHMNDGTPMCERHEANYIQSGYYQNQNSHDSYSHRPQYEQSQSNNDSEKSLKELVNSVKNDLEDFKSYMPSKRTDYDHLHDENFCKPTGVLPNQKSKTVNQEPQSETTHEKSITKFLDCQRVTNIFVKNNVKDMILKMKQNEKNYETIFKNMKRKINEWSKSQNVPSEQTDRTDPPPPANTEHVNVIFTNSGKSDYPPKIQKEPPHPIIVNNKIEKDKHIKTTKRVYIRGQIKRTSIPCGVHTKNFIASMFKSGSFPLEPYRQEILNQVNNNK
nr:hypothetical protein [Tanacetum cinerariifolium]